MIHSPITLFIIIHTNFAQWNSFNSISGLFIHRVLLLLLLRQYARGSTAALKTGFISGAVTGQILRHLF